MNTLKPLFSGFVIGAILVAIIFSTTNSYLLISNKERKLSSPTAYLPKIKVPDVIANNIVKTVEAKLNQ